jgi:uncharacterized phiE125 gp8 family phage protein
MTLCPIRLEVDPVDGSPLPVDLDLVKDHCSVSGSDLDNLLEAYLFAAIAWAEGATHRTIFARAHRWVLEDLPRCDRQRLWLPRGRTVSVESIEVVTTAGAETLTGPSISPAGDDWREDLRGDDGGVLVPPVGSSWPVPDCSSPAPVTVNFTAGWAPEDVPKDLIHAILFAVADALEGRSAADLASGGKSFEAREALISSYRLTRWY